MCVEKNFTPIKRESDEQTVDSTTTPSDAKPAAEKRNLPTKHNLADDVSQSVSQRKLKNSTKRFNGSMFFLKLN